MSFRVIYTEELRALTRGRFVFFGMAALFAFVGLIGAGAAPDVNSLFVFLFLAYAVVPSGFAAFAAVQLAGPRANKFVQAIFTAPVRRSSFLLAKFCVIVTVGLLYILFTLPFLLVYVILVDVPTMYWAFLLIGLGMILFAAAYGSFLGVVFTGRSVAGPVSLGVLPIFLLLCVPFLALSALGRDSLYRTLMVHVMHVSPQVNLLEGLRYQPGAVADHAERTLWIFLAVVVALLVLAAWIYLAHQSVESWEGHAAVRSVLVLVGVLLIFAPAMAPTMSYSPDSDGGEGQYRGDKNDGYVSLALLVEPGRGVDANVFHDRNRYSTTLDLAGRQRADLIVLFFNPPGTDFGRVELHARSQYLDIEGGTTSVADFNPTQTISQGPENQQAILRVPVTVEPTRAYALKGMNYQVQLNTNVTISNPDGDQTAPPRIEAGYAEFGVPGEMDNAHQIMFVAGGIAPAFLLVTGVVRLFGRR